MTNLSPAQTAYLQKQQKHRRMISASRITLLVVFLCLWEIAADSGRIDAFIFSCPSRLTRTCLSMCRDGSLFLHTGITLAETLISFLLVLVIGTLAAVLLWLSRQFSEIMEPYLVVLNSLPKIALGPVIIILVGAGTKAIIFMALAISLIVTVLEMLSGFRSTDKELIKMAATFGASKRQIFTKVVFPSNIVTLFNSLKINIGLSLVGVIAGEFLVSKAGLGYLIVYGGQVFQLDLVMTGVLILALMAVGMYRCITLVEHRVLRSRRH